MPRKKVSLAPSAIPPPPRTTQNLWRSMRMMRRFSIRDLAASCERPEQAVGLIVYRWAAAGYLRRERTKPHAVYVIVRDTGPLPPLYVRPKRVLIDRNNGQTPPIPGGCRPPWRKTWGVS